MKTLPDVIDALPHLESAARSAAHWLAEHAQITTNALEDVQDRVGHRYADWRGVFRGECSVADGTWWLYCPMWHGAQAIKALLAASDVLPSADWTNAAKLAGEFIIRYQVQQGPDAGLLLAYEDHADKVTVSALLESLDGLFRLSEHTGDPRFSNAALDALRWCRDHAWLRGEGLVQDLYDPATRRFIHDVYPSLDHRLGRPLADDAVWLTGAQLAEDSSLRTVFYEILERLLQDESPAGNWATYGPCEIESGRIHPRHAFWWGRPLLAAWHDTNEQRWLDSAIRAGEWYRRAQRIDGGIFRATDLHFNTRSFGQATSGVLCAAILWMELFEVTGDSSWLDPIHRAFQFGMRMQMNDVRDQRLKGAVIEGTHDPDGSDRCPYFVRDLASIFFVQAAAQLMQRCAHKAAV